MERLTFHHGGRFGDCLAALYTVKAICERDGKQADLYLSDFQKGNWSLEAAKTLVPFLKTQPYIHDVQVVPWTLLNEHGFDYDLHDAECVENPQDFPEWDGKSWPSNIHLAKRYAHYFGIPWNPEAIWIERAIGISGVAPFDVVFHAPLRRTVDQEQLRQTVRLLCEKGARVLVVGSEIDYLEWQTALTEFGVTFVASHSFLDTWFYLSTAGCFLGAVSSVNMLAEAMKIPRFVQVAPGCDNVYAQGNTGYTINGWTPEEVLLAMQRVGVCS